MRWHLYMLRSLLLFIASFFSVPRPYNVAPITLLPSMFKLGGDQSLLLEALERCGQAFLNRPLPQTSKEPYVQESTTNETR